VLTSVLAYTWFNQNLKNEMASKVKTPVLGSEK
jgi:hypothetical protein